VPQKNLLYLLDAFTAIISDTNNFNTEQCPWELHFFGDGNDRQELVSATSIRGLQKYVHFHGRIPHDSVSAAIDHCHLFAFSSITEGQCLAALEILSRGRPIVATPVGAFPEILIDPELGSIAPLNETNQFARALIGVATRLMDGRVTPSAVQSRFCQRFCHDEIVERYCSFFSELLARKNFQGSDAGL
jgi:glycosyltransferase involved in cell wall biosynthesis